MLMARYASKQAKGNGGQRIYIFTEQNMVVVITESTPNTFRRINRGYIISAFNKKK